MDEKDLKLKAYSDVLVGLERELKILHDDRIEDLKREIKCDLFFECYESSTKNDEKEYFDSRYKTENKELTKMQAMYSFDDAPKSIKKLEKAIQTLKLMIENEKNS